MTIENYRIDKDNKEYVETFKALYPIYYEYIDTLQRQFYNHDSNLMTMGCSYAIYKDLVYHILKFKPKHIIEYGPGFTTLLMLRVFEDLDYKPEFTSYEDNPSFYKMLTENGFNRDNVIQLVDIDVKDAGDTYHCTYLHDLEKHKQVDFIFIDGPGNVSIDGKKLPNINLNLKVFSEYLENKHIKYFIDGRGPTQKFYREFFGK